MGASSRRGALIIIIVVTSIQTAYRSVSEIKLCNNAGNNTWIRVGAIGKQNARSDVIVGSASTN